MSDRFVLRATNGEFYTGEFYTGGAGQNWTGPEAHAFVMTAVLANHKAELFNARTGLTGLHWIVEAAA